MLIEETPQVREKLDGLGSRLKYPFVEAVRKLGRRFDSAFEWCSGIGEIGMSLLREDLCAKLCLSDINPEAIKIARQIADRDKLTHNIEFFVGNNLDPVPPYLKFDLVVSNPPNYYNIQEAHPYGKFYKDDLRPNDRKWRIHENFYANIGRYLMPNGVMLIHEVEPYKKEVFIPHPSGYTGPYDVRDEVPMDTFTRMAADNRLKIDSVFPIMEIAGLQLYALKIIPKP